MAAYTGNNKGLQILLVPGSTSKYYLWLVAATLLCDVPVPACWMINILGGRRTAEKSLL